MTRGEIITELTTYDWSSLRVWMSAGLMIGWMWI